MTPRSSDTPFRLGIIGLDRLGLFLLERWSDRSTVTVPIACDPDPRARSIASALCPQVETDAESLLAAGNLDAVLVDVPIAERATVATRVLAAGLPLVIAEPPVAATLDEARALFAAARQFGQSLLAWSPGREDEAFQAALTSVRLQPADSLRSLRYERWAAATLPIFDERATGLGAFGGTLVTAFDQLLALAGAAPRSVFASRTARGVTAVVTFTGEATAVVTLGAGTSVNLDSGWAIDGTHGGFAGQRRWVRAHDGEVYEVPVEPSPLPTLDDTLCTLLRGESPTGEEELLRLVALLEAVDRALRTGQKTDVAAAR